MDSTTSNSAQLLANAHLILAVQHRDFDEVKRLIDGKEAEVDCHDENGCTPLNYAVMCADVKILSYLIQEGADITSQCNGKNLRIIFDDMNSFVNSMLIPCDGWQSRCSEMDDFLHYMEEYLRYGLPREKIKETFADHTARRMVMDGTCINEEILNTLLNSIKEPKRRSGRML